MNFEKSIFVILSILGLLILTSCNEATFKPSNYPTKNPTEISERTHPEWGTKGETAYWSVSSPCLIFSKLVIDTTTGAAEFYNAQMHAWAPKMIKNSNL